TQQHDAVPGAELHHRAPGHLSIPKLRKGEKKMGSPYVGEIRMFAGNFAPNGWMFCEGQILPISENETLFNLIGTTYGGDGQSTFALPNLASRVPVHMGTGGGQTVIIGESGGVETVTLTTSQIPAHSHVPTANAAAGNNANPTGL